MSPGQAQNRHSTPELPGLVLDPEGERLIVRLPLVGAAIIADPDRARTRHAVTLLAGAPRTILALRRARHPRRPRS
jgi:hypothetical protein